MAKSRLGRGLGSLFEDPSPIQADEDDNVINVKITQVEPNKNQPRKKFDEDKLNSLAQSIKEHGVIQPIIVVKNNDRYKIVAGERRWRAAKLAGLKEIPIVTRDYSDKDIAQIALIENLQRENLNPIEEAIGYQTLMSKFDMTQEDVSARIGKSRSAIANSIRLLALDEPIQSRLVSGEISSGHARAILSVEDSQLRLTLLDSIIEKGLNVRQAELLARQLQKAVPKKKQDVLSDELKIQLESIENHLSSQLGTKVKISHSNKRGKIEIEYFGNDDLDRILNLISN